MSLEKFKQLKSDIGRSKGWRDLIGSHYAGGSGGIGRVASAYCEIQIYHQARDGDNNYHKIPNKKLEEHLGKIVKKHAPELIDEAIREMEKELSSMASDIQKEYEEVISLLFDNKDSVF